MLINTGRRPKLEDGLTSQTRGSDYGPESVTSKVRLALPHNPVPHVGIFWKVPHEGAFVLVTDSVPLTEAEVYGDCLTHPRGHYEVWGTWQQLGSRELKRRGLPIAILQHEYEHFPRGRVVCDLNGARFTIYADAELQSADFITRVVQALHISTGGYDVHSDSHYRTV